MGSQTIVATIFGAVALAGWWHAFTVTKEKGTGDYAISVCPGIVVFALAASAFCATALWNA